MNYPVQHHEREDGCEVHIGVPEEGARPLFGLFAPEANCEVDQAAAQEQSAYQVEVAHRAHHEEDKGDCQHEDGVEQDLPPRFRLAFDHWEHGDACLFIIFLDEQ